MSVLWWLASRLKPPPPVLGEEGWGEGSSGVDQRVSMKTPHPDPLPASGIGIYTTFSAEHDS